MEEGSNFHILPQETKQLQENFQNFRENIEQTLPYFNGIPKKVDFQMA